MKRRVFTQLVALGAGSWPLFAASAREKDGALKSSADESKDTGESTRGVRREQPASGEPVTVADFQSLAKAKLPPATYDYITTGSADGITLRENVAAFRRIRVLPPLLKGVSQAELATTVLKQPISLPVMLAPVAAQRMYHPQGALASARAAASAGTLFGVSSSAGNSAEEIARAAVGPKWFQLYVPKDRRVARKLVRRVEGAGYQALIVTVDLGEWKDADRRNRFALPREMLLKHLRDIGFQVPEEISDEDLQAFNRGAWDLSLSWDFFDWLRSITKLPLVVKGVLRKEDARKAVSIGLDGIIVSNHGGRRLDGMPASIDMLSDIVETVGGRAEVFLDSGVRRGTDVLKALALGAKAVLIGRPYVWALAAGGEEGVRKVIELFREELTNAMIASGCPTLADIDGNLLMESGELRVKS